ncbi:MAG: PKD domain-containing protein, partial [Methanoregula sp.]
MNRKNILVFVLILHLLIGGILVRPVTAATTELTITKYANDGITILNQTTKNYSWLEANLPVKGDGSTHYYHQGPTFNDSDPYDPGEWQNVLSRDWGAVKGTDVKDLCGLVGGAHTGDTIRIKAADGMTLNYPYEYVYTPNPRQGPMVITWYNGEESAGGYENQGTGYPPDYFKGMRLIMFADTSTNPWGYHVFGNNDMLQVWAPQYRYNFSVIWPSAGGISEYGVRYVSIMSTEPVPTPPSAMFTSNKQTGTAPLTILFTDQSTGTAPLAYNWDFNNDRTVDSTVKNPSYTFTTAGTYTVNLTVTNIAGSDFELKTNYITVNPAPVPPVAAFTSDVQSGTAPLLVHFTDQSTNTPTSWKWEYRAVAGVWTEFGSGARNPSQTFTLGTYDIRLTATNAGGSDSEIKSSYIAAGTPVTLPVAGFSSDVTSGTVPLAVQFTDTSTGTGIIAWNWDFNHDGITDSSSRNPSFTYTSPGTYTVSLTVTNSAGSDGEIKSNYITVNPVPVDPITNFTRMGIFRASSGYWYFDYNLDGVV